MRRQWIVTCIAVCLLSTVALAKQGIVRTKDGNVLEGDVTEMDARVLIKIRGIQTEVNRNDVTSITYLDSIDQQYEQRMGALGARDVNGRLQVARWAFDAGRYDLARTAVDSALTIEPNNADATSFLELIRSQIALERSRGAAGEVETEPPTAPPVQPGPGPAIVDRHYLTPDQINEVRQKALKPTDMNVRIRFENDVRRRYCTASNKVLQEFLSLRPVDQAIEILDNADPRFAEDVRVLGDPAALFEYRRLQPMLLQNCATAACHGGAGAGGFVMYSGTEAAIYTNYYILETYRTRVTGTDRRMIDRTRPVDSLLLQYGLPPSVSEFDHPDVAGYRPMFRNRDDPRYRQVSNWIHDRLSAVDPQYSFKLETAASEPATGAAPPTPPNPQPPTDGGPGTSQPAPPGAVTPPAEPNK